MNQETKCPKCGSEMREGGLFINVTSSPNAQSISTTLSGFPGPITAIPPVTTGEGPFWRERTGQKKGWLVKREETQTLRISGLRCINCGYIELYAHQNIL